MRRTSTVLALSVLLSLSAWVGASSETHPSLVRDRIARGSVWVDDRLYCGMSMPGGGTVTDAEIETFLVEVVEPRFPDGFTVWRARGGWLGGREETVVIEIAHVNQPSANLGVQQIGEEYRRRFRQSAVLRMIVPAQVRFITE